MQAVITEEIIYNIRAMGLVIMITWFFFRWKWIYVKELVEKKVLDEIKSYLDLGSFIPVRSQGVQTLGYDYHTAAHDSQLYTRFICLFVYWYIGILVHLYCSDFV